MAGSSAQLRGGTARGNQGLDLDIPFARSFVQSEHHLVSCRALAPGKLGSYSSLLIRAGGLAHHISDSIICPNPCCSATQATETYHVCFFLLRHRQAT